MSLKERVISFWFKDVCKKPETLNSMMSLWFGSSPETDSLITREFKSDLDLYSKMTPEEAAKQCPGPEGSLALIILFDQFSRNIHRNTPAMFATDSLAVAITKNLIKSGKDLVLLPIYASFVYLPLEHSENLEDQKLCVEKYDILAAKHGSQIPLMYGFLNYAKEHFEIINKFSRFPHRNAILNRSNTPEEESYLSSLKDGQAFGVKASK